VDYQIRIDKGLSYNPQSGLRQMRGGTGAYVLPYSLLPENASGGGAGFVNPTRIVIRASVLGVAYRDLPGDDYTDTLRVVLEY
jgi:spore coat protein U-like protein